MQENTIFEQTAKLNNACQVLGVSTSATLPEIREKFKKLVLMHHPDKGGAHETFSMIKNAYNYIYIIKQNEAQQERRQNMKLSQYLQERNLQTLQNNGASGPIMNSNGQVIQSQNSLFMPSQTQLNDSNVFNEHFEKNKKHDAYDEGREYFLKQTNVPQQMQIAIIKEPSAFNGTFIENVRNCNGDETVNDYSTYVNKTKNKHNTACYDIKHAYANQPILENNMPNCRQDTFLTSTAMTKFKSERNNIQIPIHSQQHLFNSLEQKEKQEKEKNRLYTMQKQKEIMERQFLRI